MTEPTQEQDRAMSDMEHLHADAHKQYLLTTELEVLAVAHARAIGVTWQMLADRFGGSRQSWQQKHRFVSHPDATFVNPVIDGQNKRRYTGPPKTSPIFKKKA